MASSEKEGEETAPPSVVCVGGPVEYGHDSKKMCPLVACSQIIFGADPPFPAHVSAQPLTLESRYAAACLGDATRDPRCASNNNTSLAARELADAAQRLLASGAPGNDGADVFFVDCTTHEGGRDTDALAKVAASATQLLGARDAAGDAAAMDTAASPATTPGDAGGGAPCSSTVRIVATTDPSEYVSLLDTTVSDTDVQLFLEMEKALTEGTRGAVGPVDTARWCDVWIRASARAASRTGAPLFLRPFLAPVSQAGCPAGGQGDGAAEDGVASAAKIAVDLVSPAGAVGAEGVDPRRIVVLGCGFAAVRSADAAAQGRRVDSLAALAGLGCVLSMDPSGSAGLTFAGLEAPRDAEIADLVAAVVARVPCARIVSGAGVRSRAQLLEGGGAGYAHRATAERAAAAREDCVASLLSWWTPPKVVEAPVPTIPCSRCGKEKPVTHDFFTKFHFRYCSPKCFKKDTPRWSTFVKKEDPSKGGGPTGGSNNDGAWELQT